ncbi:Elongation of very long chain fatty acids protein [Balamuthia mandrillaris]
MSAVTRTNVGYERLCEEHASPFCRYIDFPQLAEWMRNNLHIPVLISLAYVVVIFALKRFMRDRKPYSLRTALILWNAFLALYSLISAVVVMPVLLSEVWELGFVGELCSVSTERYLAPWVLMFCLSKIPELVDTLFIVLRKRPLIFLHWYHHLATLIFCWEACALNVSTGVWFAGMNLTVHSIMYSYYCLTAMGYRFSQPLRLSITSLQISQMVMGLIIIVSQLSFCSEFHERNTYFGLAMYLSYFVLFAKLFVENVRGGHPGARAGQAAAGKKDQPSKTIKEE